MGSRNDSRGRQFHRKYYRRDKERHRSFSRDMRSRSRKNRPDERDNRSGSRGRKNDEMQESRCTRCTCDDCKKIGETANDLNVNWCEEHKENEEAQGKGSEQHNQIMILDLGAPVSVSGRKWIEEYLKRHGMTLQDLIQVRCYQKLTFGPSRQYISRLKVELPVKVQDMENKEETLKVPIYIVEADLPFLCGKSKLQDNWKSKINTESNILEAKINGQWKKLRMIGTAGNHIALKIGNEVLIDDNERDKCSKKHENKNDVRNHKEEYDKRPENERKEPKKEEKGNEIVCNLCEERFDSRRELRGHGEKEYSNVTYKCVHVYCGNRYMWQDKWREHMREEHEIGNYCETCNEYCLFKDDLEEHMESHITETVYEKDLEEHTEIECRQCKKIIESEGEIEKHEDEGKECDKCDKWLCHELDITKHKKEEQCDQCGEHLCHGMSIERHKKREHGTTREEGKGETMENQIEGEIIKDRNDGQECDQWEKWQYDGRKPKKHKKKCDKSNRKRHRKKKRSPTGKKKK